MKKIRYIKGIHPAIVFPSLAKKKSLVGRVVFNESCVYENSCQDSWNKLIGLKKKFFSPRDTSVMIGWRIYKNRLELCAYYHINNGSEYLKSKGLTQVVGSNAWYTAPLVTIEIPPEDKWEIEIPYSIVIDSEDNSYHVNCNGNVHTVDHDESFKKGSLIKGYFGGRCAPNKSFNYKISY